VIWLNASNPNSPAMKRAAKVDWSRQPQKITFAEMRDMGVRGPSCLIS
jgi:hypothetical protein